MKIKRFSDNLRNKSDKAELYSVTTDLLYQNYLLSFAGILITAAVTTYLVYRNYGYSFFESPMIRFWFPVTFILLLLKLVISLIYRHASSLYSIDERTWRHFYYILVSISGSAIGSSAYFTRVIVNPEHFLILVMVVGTLSSASTAVLSPNLKALTLFNFFMLAPYLVQFLHGGKWSGVLIIIVWSYVIYTTSKIINRTLIQSLMLKIENDRIISRLKQSEEKFSKSFHSGAAPMALLRFRDAMFLDANDAFLNLLNYSREEIINKTPYDLELYDNPGAIVELIIETQQNGFIHNREITLLTRDGIARHCIITVESFSLDNSMTALCMLQDFSERLEYQRQLQIERDRYENAANVKSRFLATMSHEIRTPMNSIIGMTNLAIISEDNVERNDYLGVVKESAEYLLVLLNDILDISSLEAGKVRLDMIDSDLYKIVEISCRSMEMFAKNRKLQFSWTIDPGLPRFIKAAPERLRQVLINLISNAIKFTPDGGISVDVSIWQGENYHIRPDHDQYIEFAVTDTGIGIPESKIEKIFDSFTQADESTFRKYGGTGLGLTISKNLITIMNGDIRVESILGKGSTFSFIIPLVAGKQPVEDTDYLAPEKTTGSARILIAEDNIMNQKLISAYMKKTGHRYMLVENGADAIDALKNEKFDTVLMDLEMPVMDGRDSLLRIRSGEAGESNKNIPVFAMSAHVMTDIIDSYIREGFTGYITKPIDLKKLKDIL